MLSESQEEFIPKSHKCDESFIKNNNMKYIQTIVALTLVSIITSCSKGKLEEKGFQVISTSDNSNIEVSDGLNRDSLKFVTQPSSVLLTGVPNIRLTTIYKVNINKNNKSTYIGSNSFHTRDNETDINTGNNWNNNLMPGIQAVYGYNMVNISHYNINENKQKNFFEKPVLIRTLYYPAFSKDTLNYKPVTRNYFIISVYNDDTNKDGYINQKDLRRFYLYNINGERQKALVPENYSVFKSEYDPANDYLYVFAQLDNNNNGIVDEGEPIHVFWIDLKDPNKAGRQY